jgi:hypothetical protein
MSDKHPQSTSSSAAARVHALGDISGVLEIAFVENGLLIPESNFGPAFFDLRSGLAGELFQKFVNYRLSLAIVVAEPSEYGDRFRELVHEHRAHPMIRFFTTETAAHSWLSSVRGRIES